MDPTVSGGHSWRLRWIGVRLERDFWPGSGRVEALGLVTHGLNRIAAKSPTTPCFRSDDFPVRYAIRPSRTTAIAAVRRLASPWGMVSSKAAILPAILALVFSCRIHVAGSSDPRKEF